ncbi:MAG: OmpA family protein [Bacteroidales bacterium]|jgi:outer membrane protein OmpA-like peptidoglycan-associated protein|nr:OmpA family protein [Bacteroidales bacterium]
MRKIITLLIINILVFQFTLCAQDNVNLKETFLDAEYYILYEDFQEALPLYTKLLNNGLSNAYISYRIGECYLNIPGQKHNSIQYLENAIKNISPKIKEGSFKETNAPKKSLFLLGKAYQKNNELEKAITTYNSFKTSLDVKDIYNIDYVDQEIKACNNAMELMKSPIKYKKTNLGETINNNYSNIRPVLSSDENIIIFTTKLKFYDAIFFSKKENNKWTAPTNLTSQLETDGALYSSSLSSDGTKLFLFKTDQYNGDIFVSDFDGKKWSKAIKLDKNINSKSWETNASISSDKKTLYFTSNRKGGYGGLDIYKSEYDLAKKEWSEPTNLGPEINTPYNEETPNITENGKTLYFSSQGHYTMGGFDIFYSNRLENNSWSSPVNIGYPINTTDDDLFFVPIKNGTFAYVSRFNKNGYGKEDIYKLEIFSPNHPYKIKIKGTLLLQDKQKEFTKGDFNINIKDSAKLETIKTLLPDTETGKFETNLTPGTYNFIFESKRYKQKVTTIVIPENFQRNELIVHTKLVPLSVSSGEYITIKSLFFDFDNYDLTRESKIELERLYNIMNKYSSLYVEVIGHTDAIGASEYNKKLSTKRARAAIDYLANKGIDQSRFVAKGVGKLQPIALNSKPNGADSPEGRKYNRRVTIKILKSNKNIYLGNDINIPENLKHKNLSYSIFLLKQKDKLPNKYFKKYTEFTNYKIQEYYSNNTYYYILGRFKKKSELIILFNKVIDLGFDNARIVNNFEIGQMQSPTNKAISNNSNKPIFTIQLKATKSPADISVFAPLKNIKEILGDDGFYRYIYKEFNNYKNAQKEWNKIINIGYPDAFIVNIDKYKNR